MSLYEKYLESLKASAIGMSVDEVSEEVKKTGWSIRVMSHDGRKCVGACDYNQSRINVAAVDGKVTEIIGLG